MTATSDADLRTLKDKQEIHDALMRYCRGVDRCDRDLIASALHPDASIDTGRQKTTGALAPDLFVGTVKGHKASMHFVGNELVEVDGDVAFAETYIMSYLVLTENGKDHTRVRGSRYVDRFEKRDGAWKVAQRIVVDDWARYDEIVGVGPFMGEHRGAKAPDDAIYLMKRGAVPAVAGKARS